MEHFGLIPALVAMFFIAAFGGHEFKFVEVLILAIAHERVRGRRLRLRTRPAVSADTGVLKWKSSTI